MSVADIEIDIVNYAGPKDFQVSTEYNDNDNYTVVVRRLDANEGWKENLSVLAVYTKRGEKATIPVGSSSDPVKRVTVHTEFPLGRCEATKELTTYTSMPFPEPQRLSRAMFNKLFNANIKALPHNLFALGIRNNNVYIYNETYDFLFMIELTLRHIVGTVLHHKLFREVYFIVCAYDGYLEHHYPTNRTNPREVGELEFKDKKYVTVDADNEYPVFHKDKWILAQSTKRGVPFCADMPDRYYFCLNHYNGYRSVHEGIPFDSKISKIVYASQPRGTKYNFTTRRDIEVTQREYFNSDKVPKTNIVAPQWIDRKEQIKYKYVLDIDGNSSTWDATAWKLNSGSVLLKTDSAWRQWFYDELLPWTHYVPIKDDFSDIDEKFAWCESHQDECRAMIAECKKLFQKAYHYPNIIKYTIPKLYEVSNLKPIEIGDGRRLFIFRTHHPEIPNGIPSVQTSNRLVTIQEACRKINPNDLIMYFNSELADYIAFDPKDFVARYDSIGHKIVAAAERNLWPAPLEPHRRRFEQAAPANNPFRYLQGGLVIGTAGEFYRIYDERIYDPSVEIYEQEYMARAWLTNNFDITLDYHQKLVLATYMCSREEVNKYRENKVPFILWNGGRF
jgi:hypothetical protein